MSITTDRNDPLLHEVQSNGQNKAYLVAEDDGEVGFVRPVRMSYRHKGVRPVNKTRALTAKEVMRYGKEGYVLYEEYPASYHPRLGRLWKKADLNSGCGGETIVSERIAEQYAKDPKFYSSTFCVHCEKHLPVEEFVWNDDDSVVGS